MLDDMIIYSETPQEHVSHVRAVLAVLRKHKLYAKMEKCQFYVDTISFPGYRISPAGPPGMDSAAGRALQEAANIQFGSYDWRVDYGRYGREPVSIEVAEEGIQEAVYNAKERERLVEIEAASKYIC